MILATYILRSLVRPFLLGFGFVTFLLMMEMLLDLLDLLIGKGIDGLTVFRLFLLALGWMVALSVPCGVLVAVLMTYGRMSQDNEITALRASGVHLARVVLPSVAFASILAIGLALFNNYVLPDTNYAYAKLMQQISRKNPTAQIREGVIINDFDGYSIRINRLDDRSGLMEDIMILDASGDPGTPRTILATTGTLRYAPERKQLTLELHDGTIHEADGASRDGAYRVIAYTDQTLTIMDGTDAWSENAERRRGDRELSIPEMKKEVAQLNDDRVTQRVEMNGALQDLGYQSRDALANADPTALPARGWSQLEQTIRSKLGAGPDTTATPKWSKEQEVLVSRVRSLDREIEALEKRMQKYEVEIQKKFSIPAACIVFVLMGAPLGMLARRGGMAIGFLSGVFFIFYYLFLIGGEQLADRLLLPAWLAMWLPNLLLGGLGIVLSFRALRSGRVSPPRGASR